MNQIESYQKEVKNIDEELHTLPDGHLVRKNNCYYHAIGKKEVGITKKPKIIRQLCRKKYLLVRKQQLINNIAYLPVDLSKIDKRLPWEIIATFATAYQGLPVYYFYHPAMETWVVAEYPKHPYPPEDGNHMTVKGLQLRSKSELLIATQLEVHQLPYRYEAKLTLGNKIEYPDFIIRNPFNGKVILWEHFGALHLSGYEKKMNEKMDLYLRHGYSLSDTLIYTFEFQVQNTQRLQALIEDIIL